MKGECACGQRPVDNRRPAVENPARKILDTMSLNLKTDSYKSRSDSQPTGVREAIHSLEELVGSILNALDLLTARIDAIQAQIEAPAFAAYEAGADLQPDQEVVDHA